jgi:RNA polymerase sigma factor (sigma-70 family)
MTIQKYIQNHYDEIKRKIIAVTKNHQHTDDLISDLILDLLEKNNDFITELLHQGKVQHYLIKSAYIQYNSSTSPFYLKYRKQVFGELPDDIEIEETQEIHQDTEKLVRDVKLYIGNLPVYERTLAERNIIDGKSQREISKMYSINRVHITKDINNIKRNIRVSFNKQEYKTK